MAAAVASAQHFSSAGTEHSELADYWAEYKDLYQGLHNHQRDLYEDTQYEAPVTSNPLRADHS